MSLVGDFSIPAEEFVLARTFAELPSLRVEFERVVAGAAPLPYLTVRGERAESFVEAARADPTVRNVTVHDDQGSELLCELDWRRLGEELLGEFTDRDPILLGAAGRAGTWEMEVRFPDREALSRFKGACESIGVHTHLRGLSASAEPGFDRYGLTPGQREALTTAARMGLFEVPRAATLSAVAVELGVSTHALSERLRRGQASLVRSALGVDTG